MSEGTEAIRPVIPQGEGFDDVGTPIDAAKKELNNLIEALADDDRGHLRDSHPRARSSSCG
jgi:hypothetical protein